MYALWGFRSRSRVNCNQKLYPLCQEALSVTLLKCIIVKQYKKQLEEYPSPVKRRSVAFSNEIYLRVGLPLLVGLLTEIMIFLHFENKTVLGEQFFESYGQFWRRINEKTEINKRV